MHSVNDSSSSSWSGRAACGPWLPARLSVLGASDTWILRVLTDTYSFSSGALLDLMSKVSGQLMARSAEQTENGSLSSCDTSLPGLLSCGSEFKLSEVLSSQGGLPPAVAPVGAGDTGVSFEGSLLLLMVGSVLAGTLLSTVLVGTLWSDTKPVGTLGGTEPASVELMGNLDGASTLVGIIPGGFELVGNLEGTVLVNAEWGGTLEGTVLVVTELVGTLVPLGLMEGSAWSPAPTAKASLEEEEVVPVDTADTRGSGMQLALGVERARGWKETVGDTGPRGDVRLDTTPAM